MPIILSYAGLKRRRGVESYDPLPPRRPPIVVGGVAFDYSNDFVIQPGANRSTGSAIMDLNRRDGYTALAMRGVGRISLPAYSYSGSELPNYAEFYERRGFRDIARIALYNSNFRGAHRLDPPDFPAPVRLSFDEIIRQADMGIARFCFLRNVEPPVEISVHLPAATA